MGKPCSSAEIRARLYRGGENTRENAFHSIACAIIRRRGVGEDYFYGRRRHARAVGEALDRSCEGGA